MIETREVYAVHKEYIEDLTAFGWQKTEVVSRGSARSRSSYQVMARETGMPNYVEILKLENDYETAKKNLKSYKSMEFGVVLLFFLIFILPGIIYVLFKSNQKQNIEYHNAKCNAEMNAAKDAAKKLIKG